MQGLPPASRDALREVPGAGAPVREEGLPRTGMLSTPPAAGDENVRVRGARARVEVRPSVEKVAPVGAILPEDIVATVQIDTPVLSPDGQHAVFVRSALDAKSERRQGELYTMPVSGGAPRPLAAITGVSRPSFSPDGSQLAVLHTATKAAETSVVGAFQQRQRRHEKPQLWLIPAGGGEARQLTNVAQGIQTTRPEGVSGTAMKTQHFVWAPDGKALYFITEDAPSHEDEAAEALTGGAYAAFEGPNGQSRARFANVWRADAVTGEVTPVTREAAILFDLDVSLDGTKLAVAFRRENARNAGDRTELGIIDIATGKLEQLTHNQVPEWRARFSPDGKRLAYLSPHAERWELRQPKIFVTELGSGETRCASAAFDGAIYDYQWLPDGDLALTGARGFDQSLFRVEVATGALLPLVSVQGELRDVDLAGGAAVGVFSDVMTPPELVRLDLATGTKTRLTELNPGLSSATRGTLSRVRWTSPDGLEIEGLLCLPKDAKGSAPMILQIHGGPASVSLDTWEADRHLWAARGIASLWPNPRGSKAYGDDFLRMNQGDLGGGDYQDIMSGVDAMVARGIADPERLAVRGWSYGAILGGNVITKTSRFKAAMLGAGVYDWASEYGQGFSHDLRLWYIGGAPWENPEGYRRASTMPEVSRIETPTLLLHGDSDIVCTPQQSMNLFNALWERQVPSRLVRFPGAAHSLSKPGHQRVRLLEELAWLEQYLSSR